MGTRRAQIASLEDTLLSDDREDSPVNDIILEDLAKALANTELIPVIGDAIRLSHIFGGNNVVEQLAKIWAKQIGYPLVESSRLARVAQYRVFTESIPDAQRAKQAYLDFLKRTLLYHVGKVADVEEDSLLSEKVQTEKKKLNGSITFADIVANLGFPHFDDSKRDPLKLLATLPIKYYLTTSYHDFIERALLKADKEPSSTMCFWSLEPENVNIEHRYPEQEPDIHRPLVYHLFGMEQYASSMVLSEDDYFDNVKLGSGEPFSVK